MDRSGLNPGNIMGLYILDAAGEPVEEPDVLKWGDWLNGGDRRIARDELPDGYVVSTVFLGIDHGFGGVLGDRAPILYETMVFNDCGSLDQDWAFDRYETRQQALEGHQAVLVELKLHLAEKAAHGQ